MRVNLKTSPAKIIIRLTILYVLLTLLLFFFVGHIVYNVNLLDCLIARDYCQGGFPINYTTKFLLVFGLPALYFINLMVVFKARKIARKRLLKQFDLQ